MWLCDPYLLSFPRMGRNQSSLYRLRTPQSGIKGGYVTPSVSGSLRIGRNPKRYITWGPLEREFKILSPQTCLQNALQRPSRKAFSKRGGGSKLGHDI